MGAQDLSAEYSGGLDTNGGKDGDYTYVWQGDVTHAVFQVGTLMPNSQTDPQQNNKRMHIDNNLVTIVFNDSTVPFERGWLGGAVNYVFITVSPMGESAYRIGMNTKEGMDSVISLAEERIVSAECVGVYCRMLAIHANLASRVHRKLSGSWEERLKLLKTIATKHADNTSVPTNNPTVDFTNFA